MHLDRKTIAALCRVITVAQAESRNLPVRQKARLLALSDKLANMIKADPRAEGKKAPR
jgi:hypothetical protein